MLKFIDYIFPLYLHTSCYIFFLNIINDQDDFLKIEKF